jgi:putative MATE family efflux protein
MLADPPLALIVRLASPNAIAFLVQAAVSMTEVWFIGRLGTYSLAAIALMFPALMLVQMLANGAVGGAVSSAIARAVGGGARERAEALVWHALAIALGAGFVLWAVWHFGHAALFRGLDLPAEVVAEATRYGTVLFAGATAVWTMALMASVFRGIGDMRFPAIVSVLGAAVQIPLSGALVLGWFGWPSLGIAGAAISTLTVATLVSGVFLLALARGTTVVKLRWRALSLRWALFADIFRVGALASLSPVFVVLTIMLLNGIVSGFGPSALAGYGIAARLEFLLVPLVFGIGAALTALVGTNAGAGQLPRAHAVAWTGGACAAALTGAIGTTLAIHPGLWMDLFTDDPETWRAGAAFLRIVGPAFAFQGLGLALYFASQGAGTVVWPVFATVLRFVLAVGGATVAVRFFAFGIDAVYAWIAIGMVVYGTLTAGSILLGAWYRTARA